MVNENNILEYIKNSNLIEKKLKNNLIKNFYKISENQINLLVNHFNKQKNEILKILMTLKNKKICSLQEIKNNLDKVNRDFINKKEFEEKQNKENIFNLLDY